MPLYREDLEALGRCGVPGCTRDHRDDEVYLHAQCHPASPVWARYRGDVLTIECARCRRPVIAVVVASRRADAGPLDPPDEEAVP